MYKILTVVACLVLLGFGLPIVANSGCCGAADKDGGHGSNGNGEGLKPCCEAAIAEGKPPCCTVLSGSKHKCPADGNCPGLAPDFTLTDQDGKKVTLSDLIGKKIVVLEWANWDCPFVVPHYKNKTFADLIDKYTGKDPETDKEKEVVWLTINSTHYAKTEANKAWAKKYDLTHPILSDPTGKAGHLYKATNTPHLYILDKTGHIAYRGAIDNAPLGRLPEGQEYVNYVDAALAELTAGKDVSRAYTKAYGCTVKYPPKEAAGSGG